MPVRVRFPDISNRVYNASRIFVPRRTKKRDVPRSSSAYAGKRPEIVDLDQFSDQIVFQAQHFTIGVKRLDQSPREPVVAVPNNGLPGLFQVLTLQERLFSAIPLDTGSWDTEVHRSNGLTKPGMCAG